MDTQLKLEKSWPEVKELLKEVNHELTDEDLNYDPENADALLERLATKMSRTPAHIKSWIESVSSNHGIAG